MANTEYTARTSYFPASESAKDKMRKILSEHQIGELVENAEGWAAVTFHSNRFYMKWADDELTLEDDTEENFFEQMVEDFMPGNCYLVYTEVVHEKMRFCDSFAVVAYKNEDGDTFYKTMCMSSWIAEQIQDFPESLEGTLAEY